MKILLSLLVTASVLLAPLQVTLADVWVNGYTKSNGTYVQGHYRSNSDGNPYNNWSYPGNTNPYTGVTAGGNPSTYLNNYYNNSSPSIPSYTSSYTPSYTSSYSNSYEDMGHGYKSYGIVFCDYGYYEKNDKCIKEPTNGYAIGSTIYCDYGYTLSGSKCLKETDYSSGSYYGSYDSLSSCPAHSSESLTDSSKCTCNLGYEVNKDKTKCIKNSTKENNALCKASFGKNSIWSKEYNESDSITCTCKNKYEWNNTQTSCVKE